nr:hypothetical protein [Vibrio cholerae]
MLCLSLVVMRCQPLRRALTGKMEMSKASEQKEFTFSKRKTPLLSLMGSICLSTLKKTPWRMHS